LTIPSVLYDEPEAEITSVGVLRGYRAHYAQYNQADV